MTSLIDKSKVKKDKNTTFIISVGVLLLMFPQNLGQSVNCWPTMSICWIELFVPLWPTGDEIKYWHVRLSSLMDLMSCCQTEKLLINREEERRDEHAFLNGCWMNHLNAVWQYLRKGNKKWKRRRAVLKLVFYFYDFLKEKIKPDAADTMRIKEEKAEIKTIIRNKIRHNNMKNSINEDNIYKVEDASDSSVFVYLLQTHYIYIAYYNDLKFFLSSHKLQRVWFFVNKGLMRQGLFTVFCMFYHKQKTWITDIDLQPSSSSVWVQR